MEGSRHIDRIGIALGALEPDILRPRVGADAAQELAQRRAGPAADRAPALDAHVARDLFLLRQRVELVEAPAALLVDEAAHLKPVVGAVHYRGVVFRVVGVERERTRDRALRIGRGKLVRMEDQGLDAIIEPREVAQRAFGGVAIDDIATGQESERAKACRPAQEQAARRIGQQPRGILDEQLSIDPGHRLVQARHDLLLAICINSSLEHDLFPASGIHSRSRRGGPFGTMLYRPRIIARRLLGTMTANATCTTRNTTMAVMAAKCT